MNVEFLKRGFSYKKLMFYIPFPEDINRNEMMEYISKGDMEKIPEGPREELKKLKLPRFLDKGWLIKEKEGKEELFLFIVATFYSKEKYEIFLDEMKK